MFLLFFLIFSHLFKPSTSQLPCLPSFHNKTVGPYVYSLYNPTNPGLQIIKLDCSKKLPKSPPSETRNILLVYNKTSDNQPLGRLPDCNVFNCSDRSNRLSFHHDQINYTFRECKKPDPLLDEKVEKKKKNDSMLYYNMTTPVHTDTTTNCTNQQLPFNRITLASNHIFPPVSDEFWILYEPCNDRMCEDSEEGNKRTPIIIGVTIGVGFALIVILVGAIFVICRARHLKTTVYSRDLEENSAYFGVPVFSYTELQDATQHFDLSQELGDGGFGTVYYGKLRDGREVAVKRLYEHNYKRVQQFMNEVEILTRLRHKNLVLLYGCTSRRSVELLLVYEYITNGTVADHLHGDRAKQSPLTWTIRMKIALETASALVYLHASDIIHRDVKTNNILLDQNYCVKVADFGISRLLPNDVTHVSTAPQGTPGYVDPEYHQCYQLTDKSDVYSFGVVLIELISSMPAIDISRSRDEISLANMAINRILRCALDELIDPILGSDSETVRMTRSVAELAFRCLQFDSETRPTMVEVLEFLKGIQGEDGNDVGELSTGKTQLPPAKPKTEDVGLSKEVVMSSPISVMDKWHITGCGVTTLNTSSVFEEER